MLTDPAEPKSAWPAHTAATASTGDPTPCHPRRAAIPVHQRKFGRPPAMPLIPFDIRHGHTPTDLGLRYAHLSARTLQEAANAGSVIVPRVVPKTAEEAAKAA